MSHLRNKIEQALQKRGESLQSLVNRLNAEGVACTTMTLYNWMNLASRPRDPNALITLARILQVDYDALMDSSVDSLDHGETPNVFLDQTALLPLLLDVIASPDCKPEYKKTAREHIEAWVQKKNPN